MDTDKMDATGESRMGRPREPPEPDEVLDEMVVDRCYVVADLVVAFEEQYGPPRRTVRNRLEYLVDSGEVERTKHANDTVTYRRIRTETCLTDSHRVGSPAVYGGEDVTLSYSIVCCSIFASRPRMCLTKLR